VVCIPNLSLGPVLTVSIHTDGVHYSSEIPEKFSATVLQ